MIGVELLAGIVECSTICVYNCCYLYRALVQSHPELIDCYVAMNTAHIR